MLCQRQQDLFLARTLLIYNTRTLDVLVHASRLQWRQRITSSE